MAVIERSAIKSIKGLLKLFPCVAILGARQVGKSFLLKQLFPKARIYDFEDEDDLNLARASVKTFIQSSGIPLVIDEAQLLPEFFKSLRVEIDKNRKENGRFIITGSSSPQLLKDISESLAGRIAIVELNNLSLEEAYSKSSSDFANSVSNLEKLKKLKPRYTKKELNDLLFFGQYPEPFIKRQNNKFHKLWMKNYFKTYVDRDVRSLFPGLKLETYKRFIKMLAYSSGNPVNISDIAKSLDVSQPTVKSYIDIAEGTFLWRNIKPYEKNLNTRIIKTPKGYIRDTGLINYSLGLKNIDELKSHPKFGSIWEIFVMEQIIKSMQNNLIENEYLYLRTKNKAEIDLIIEGESGLIPIEIKSGTNTDPRKLISLQNFIHVTKASHGILINTALEVRMLTDSIIQVPAMFL